MNISKKAIELLKEIADQRMTQNKYGTQTPIYTVQRRKEKQVDSLDDTFDVVKFYIPGLSYEGFYPSFEEIKNGCLRGSELPKELVYKLEISETEEMALRVLEEYYTGEDLELLPELYKFEFHWETIAYFLTLKEAEEYQEYQKHNLGVSRVYVVSPGYSNSGLFAQLLEMLDQGEVFEK